MKKVRKLGNVGKMSLSVSTSSATFAAATTTTTSVTGAVLTQNNNQHCDGVTSLAWFPGAAEQSMTLAVGTVQGNCYLLYNDDISKNEFLPFPVPSDVQSELSCNSTVIDLKWNPPVGRRFHLLAICTRSEVLLLRLNCISPSHDR
uniref:Uncharacterized protein n=1 Tax=Lygus hesperus TaxID=30085 RepID=A0A146KX54_LYGHE